MGRLLLALRQLTINLTAIVGDVRTSVGAIHVATGDIATGNHDLAPDWISVTLKGRLLIRNVCMVFDRYLATRGPATHSRTV